MRHHRIILVFAILLTTLQQNCSSSGTTATSSGGDNGGTTTTSSGVCTSTTAPSWNHPWPMFHGFENHLGSSSAAGPRNTSAVWTFSASTDPGNPPNTIAIASIGKMEVHDGGR